MSTTTMTAPPARSPAPGSAPYRSRSRTTRIVGVELRKMFDTRSGFWLMASIGILAVIATDRRRSSSRPTTS